MMLALTWLPADNSIVLVGTLCAVAAALLGNFLVLRKMSMLGDAVTHAVLPGIAAAFLISHSRSSFPMFIGAVLVGILTAVFTEWIRRVGKVDEGASMGVVFTSLFALGLVLVVQAADKVHLDPDCVLYGALESVPLDTVSWLGWDVPQAAFVLGPVAIINLLFVILFFKELKISSFDPALATTMGFSAKLMHYALMVLVSVTAVASFESVGSILVVAMFVVPPAAAFMLTDRLGLMIFISTIIAAASAVGGHVAAISVPGWFGFKSTTTASMISVVSGIMFVAAALLGPRHGVLVKSIRRLLMTIGILSDDIVGFLYRREENRAPLPTRPELAQSLFAGRWQLAIALRGLSRRGEITANGETIELTNSGRQRAEQLIRSHRLWEKYLVNETQAEANRIHDKAEKFEHFTDKQLRDELDRATDNSEIDPHGKPIPKE